MNDADAGDYSRVWAGRMSLSPLSRSDEALLEARGEPRERERHHEEEHCGEAEDRESVDLAKTDRRACGHPLGGSSRRTACGTITNTCRPSQPKPSGHFDGVIPHLNGFNVTLVAESIAPLEELRPYKERMGWRFPWVSSLGSDFKYDFGAAFTEEQQRNGAEYNFRHVDHPEPQREGMSAFALEDGVVHHTYSTYNRGTEQLMGTYRILDLAPLGRNEDGLEFRQASWRRHDEYETREEEARQ